MEKYLIRLVVTGLVIMVTVQAVMTQDQYRIFLSWGEKLEGQAIKYPVNAVPETDSPEPAVVSPEAVVVLALDKYSSLPKAVVMVNGQKKCTFSGSEVRLALKAGDVVEIDSRAYSFPVQFKVINLSANVAYPRQGQTWTVDQGLVMLGKIIVK